MSQDEVAGIIRHVVTIAGGYFVSRGLIDESALITIAGGAAALAGVLWSVYSKRSKV
jgi:hypothetical protein